jgi:hypothetical protein
MLTQQFGIDIVGVDNKTTVAARVLSVYLRYATLIFSVAWFSLWPTSRTHVELTAPPTPSLCEADFQRRLDVLWPTSRTHVELVTAPPTLVKRS